MDISQIRDELTNSVNNIVDEYSKIVQKGSFKTFLKNKEITIKILLKNYFRSLLLNPVQVFYGSKYQFWYEYKNSNEHHLWLKIRIVFTLLFFSFSFFGLISSFKNLSSMCNVFNFDL